MRAQASQFSQHFFDENKFADSGETCSGVVFLGMIIEPVLAGQQASILHPACADTDGGMGGGVRTPREITNYMGFYRN